MIGLRNVFGDKMNKVTIYTDGACSGNPGVGGWGALIKYENEEKELFGAEAETTNNRMELVGVISALKSLGQEKYLVDLYTDSQYVKLGITEWIKSWLKNGWKNSQKKEVKNKDLWIELLELSQRYEINWCWLKGHAGQEGNERADSLARSACIALKAKSAEG